MNSSYGISYVLPVIIALLSSRRGDLLILEHPESFLHPSGQRALGELITLATTGGVQVITETHSDHLVNGIRIAVKKGKIAPGYAGIFTFYLDKGDSYKHKAVCQSFYQDGNIDVWLEGFMDEWDSALLELL